MSPRPQRISRAPLREPKTIKQQEKEYGQFKTSSEKETAMEEAQAIAAEFIQSLDNLPAEVQHHLAEIRHRENRIAEIQARIQPKMAAYLRHSTRGGGLTPKDAALPEKIAQEQERIRELSEEKVACAERVVHLLTKAMGRLDVDLARAMDRTGEGPPQDVIMGNTGGSRTPIEKLPDTLKSALAQSDTIVLPAAGPSAGGAASTSHPPNKRRRMNSTTPAGGSPAPGADVAVPHIPASRSRLSVVHTRPASPGLRSRRATSELVKDADAEGEDDPDDPSADPEDKTLYCTCQSMSYGKMVGCDNDACPYQWFHLTCVGLQDPLPKHWFCPACVEKHGAALTGGERRRRRR